MYSFRSLPPPLVCSVLSIIGALAGWAIGGKTGALATGKPQIQAAQTEQPADTRKTLPPKLTLLPKPSLEDVCATTWRDRLLKLTAFLPGAPAHEIAVVAGAWQQELTLQEGDRNFAYPVWSRLLEAWALQDLAGVRAFVKTHPKLKGTLEAILADSQPERIMDLLDDPKTESYTAANLAAARLTALMESDPAAAREFLSNWLAGSRSKGWGLTIPLQAAMGKDPALALAFVQSEPAKSLRFKLLGILFQRFPEDPATQPAFLTAFGKLNAEEQAAALPSQNYAVWHSSSLDFLDQVMLLVRDPATLQALRKTYLTHRALEHPADFPGRLAGISPADRKSILTSVLPLMQGDDAVPRLAQWLKDGILTTEEAKSIESGTLIKVMAGLPAKLTLKLAAEFTGAGGEWEELGGVLAGNALTMERTRTLGVLLHLANGGNTARAGAFFREVAKKGVTLAELSARSGQIPPAALVGLWQGAEAASRETLRTHFAALPDEQRRQVAHQLFPHDHSYSEASAEDARQAWKSALILRDTLEVPWEQFASSLTALPQEEITGITTQLTPVELEKVGPAVAQSWLKLDARSGVCRRAVPVTWLPGPFWSTLAASGKIPLRTPLRPCFGLKK
jgi:hypothetical protein